MTEPESYQSSEFHSDMEKSTEWGSVPEKSTEWATVSDHFESERSESNRSKVSL